MTRDDIIRMAQEAGFQSHHNPDLYDCMVSSDKDIERFANLVAAAEREAILKDGWRQCAKDQRTTQFCGMLEQAVLAEREACAKVAQSFDPHMRWSNYGQVIANKIRDRGLA